ncbi:MAG: iron ABC transporter permease [Cyanobacteria bacterium J06641_5]
MRNRAIAVRIPPVSFRVNRRVPSILVALGMLTLGVVVLSLGTGLYDLSLWAVVKSLLHLEPVDSPAYFVVQELRLPRIAIAWLVGVGLAISGTLLQGLTQNPLAAPGIIGINAGAGLTAVVLLILVPQVSPAVLPLAAFVGALLCTALIYLLAQLGDRSPQRLILMGVGLTAMATALTNLLLTVGNLAYVGQALVWLVGSLHGRGWIHVWGLAPWLLLGAIAILLARDLNVLNLGDKVARGMGVPLTGRRGLLLLASAALAGASVATAGTISFVGLLSPHIARRWVGASHEGLIPTAALTGGLLVLLADWLGRSLFAPIEIPCGIVTAMLGTPYFLYLLCRQR